MFKVMIPVIVVPAAAAEAVEVEAAAAHGTTEEAIPTGMLFTFIH